MPSKIPQSAADDTALHETAPDDTAPDDTALGETASDDTAPSDNDEAIANGGTDAVATKAAKKSVDRRRKPRPTSAARTTRAAEPEEAKEALDTDDEREVDAEVLPDSAVLTSPGAEARDNGSAASAGVSETLSDTMKPAATPASESAKPNRGIARRLLRLMSFIVVIGGLIAAVYLTWPTINSRYIQPVENTAADLSTVQGQLGDVDSRLENLESTTADLGENTVANETRLDEVETGQVLLAERLDEIEDQTQQQTLRIENLDELAAALGANQEVANSRVTQQLQVTRAAERMSRARLFLYQANYGLAAADLRGARETLASLDPVAGSDYSEVIDRLDRAIVNLPEFPVAAAGDLDIAWETLLDTRSTSSSDETGSPTVQSNPGSDPQPSDG